MHSWQNGSGDLRIKKKVNGKRYCTQSTKANQDEFKPTHVISLGGGKIFLKYAVKEKGRVGYNKQ